MLGISKHSREIIFVMGYFAVLFCVGFRSIVAFATVQDSH